MYQFQSTSRWSINGPGYRHQPLKLMLPLPSGLTVLLLTYLHLLQSRVLSLQASFTTIFSLLPPKKSDDALPGSLLFFGFRLCTALIFLFCSVICIISQTSRCCKWNFQSRADGRIVHEVTPHAGLVVRSPVSPAFMGIRVINSRLPKE